MYGSDIKPILNVVCRIKAISANRSRVSHVGRALCDSRLVDVPLTSHASVPLINYSAIILLHLCPYFVGGGLRDPSSGFSWRP